MAEQSNTVGRTVKVSGASIEGIVSCLPHHQISNSCFETEFGKAAVKDVVKMIGVENRYWADESIPQKTCVNAGKILLESWIEPASIDALIFVHRLEFQITGLSMCFAS